MAKKRKSKKPNPRNIPATQADVKKAKSDATDSAIDLVWAIFFNVLRDKEQAQPEDLRRVWKECENLSDSIARGYVSVADLMKVLRDEVGMKLH